MTGNTVAVIVQGVPVQVRAGLSTTIRRITLQALLDTDSVGRSSVADWDLLEVTLHTGYDPFARPLFLSLRAGIGGACGK